MSKLATTRNIVRFRWVRPVIDLALLLVVLFVLVALRNMEIEQQLNHKPKLQIQQSVPVKKLCFSSSTSLQKTTCGKAGSTG